jgi:hypothetical protein
MTSMELKNFFKDNDLNILLDEIDQVKFAKKSPSKSEKKRYFRIIKKSYKKTIIKQLIKLIYNHEYNSRY